MMLMFTFSRPDVFPLGDLGIQNSMIKISEGWKAKPDVRRPIAVEKFG